MFALSYTPSEQQPIVAYLALVETEQITLGHEVILMHQIMYIPASHKIGHAQESSTHNSTTKVTLETTEDNGSSQLVKLKAVHQALQHEERNNVIFVPILGLWQLA